VSPSQYVFGSPVSDWQSYTPATTQGFGTPTAVNLRYRRVGSDVEVEGRFTAGTVTATEARIGLPPGFVSASTISTVEYAGQAARATGVATSFFENVVLIEPNVSYFTFGAQEATAAAALAKRNGNSVVNTGEGFSFKAKCPVAGLSSSVQMADQTSTRIVAASYYVNGGASTATNVPINYDTRNFDTHAAVTTGVGVWRFTAPVSGVYRVSAFFSNAAGSADYSIYKNGVVDKTLGIAISGTIATGGTGLVELRGGDYIFIATNATVTPAGISSGRQLSRIDICRESGPSQIASVERIAARYNVTSAASTAAAVPFNFNNKDFDTHNAVTTGVGVWKFTAPISGIYRLSGSLYTGGSTDVIWYKNGVVYSHLATAAATFVAHGTTTVSMIAGDFIDMRNTGTSTPTAAGGTGVSGANYIEIERIGGTL
jgi:hypothetical protein